MSSLGLVHGNSESVSGVASREYAWLYSSQVANNAEDALALRMTDQRILQGISTSSRLCFYCVLSQSIISLEPIIVWNFLHHIEIFCLLVSSSLCSSLGQDLVRLMYPCVV